MEARAKNKARGASDRPSVNEQLLDAASAVMIEQDTVDVSLADIAGHAGVNIALVSYYFGGKEGLLLALAKRDAARSLAELDVLMGLDLSPAAKLRKHMAGVIGTFFRYPYLNRLLRALMRDSSSRAAREIAEFFAGPIAKAISRLIKDGVKAGEIRPVDPMLFYFAMMGACDQLFSAQTVLKFVFGVASIDDNLRRRYVDTVTDLLLNGLLAPEKSPSPETGDGPSRPNRQRVNARR